MPGSCDEIAHRLVYFVRGGVPADLQTWALLAALVGLGATLIVSYARARAEGLGLECQVGIAQRAERILGLGVPSLFVGAGPSGLVLFAIVGVLALLAAITVVQRILHVRRITHVAPAVPADGPRTARKTQARQLAPDLSDITNERNVQ